MTLINGVKLKSILKSPLMALIRGTSLKSSLSKTLGHSRPKILNDLWVPESDTRPKRRLHSHLKASNAIFAFHEPRLYEGCISTAIENNVSTSIEGRVSMAIESRVPTLTKSCVSSAFTAASPKQSRVMS